MNFQYGVGLLWPFNSLLEDDFCTYRSDTIAGLRYQTISGCNTGPPTEPIGAGDDVECSYWSEMCFQNEIMSAVQALGPEPISTVTLGALEDLGYMVDYTNADPYTASNLDQSCVCPAQIRGKSLYRPGRGFNPARFVKQRFGADHESNSATPVRRRLSEEGWAAATTHGKRILAEARAKHGRHLEEGTLLNYHSVDVFYKESGAIHTVRVKTRRETD